VGAAVAQDPVERVGILAGRRFDAGGARPQGGVGLRNDDQQSLWGEFL
jgi:hypothetical protein